jgi:hypothetical protein
MAQIDTSIYGQIRPFRLRDPLETAQNALAVQNAQQANQLNALKFGEMERAQAESLADEAAMRAFYQGGGQNLNALNDRPRLRVAEEARQVKLNQDRAQIGSQNATARKNQLEADLKAAERRANLLRSATDQPSWTMLRDVIGREMGPDALSQVPQEFNQQFRDAMIGATVDEAKRISEQRQSINELVEMGPDGRPRVNPVALSARSQVAAAGVQQTPVQIVQTQSGPAMVPGRVPTGARSVDVIPLNDPTQRAPGQAVPRAQMAPPGGNKPPAEIQRMNIAADTMSKLLNDYEGLLRQNNPRDPTVQGNPALRADMQSLMKNIQLQFKELQALGALSGPDLAIMESALTDPFTFRGAIYGQEGLLNQIRRSRELISARRQATTDNTGSAANRPAAAQPGQAEPSLNDLLRQYAK